MSPVGPLPANLCILPNHTQMICFHCTDSTTFSCPLFRLAVMSNGLYVQHIYDCICDLFAKMVIFWLPLVSRPPPLSVLRVQLSSALTCFFSAVASPRNTFARTRNSVRSGSHSSNFSFHSFYSGTTCLNSRLGSKTYTIENANFFPHAPILLKHGSF